MEDSTRQTGRRSTGRRVPACGKTGYRGRFGVHEVMLVSEEIERSSSNGARPRTSRRSRSPRGCSRSAQDGLRKVGVGLTSLEEVFRVVVSAPPGACVHPAGFVRRPGADEVPLGGVDHARQSGPRFGERSSTGTSCPATTSSDANEESSAGPSAAAAVLLQLGLVGEKDLTAALAEQMGIRFIDFLETPIHRTRPACSPPSWRGEYGRARRRLRRHKLVVAFAEPADDDAVAASGRRPAYEIIPAVAERTRSAGIDMIFGRDRRRRRRLRRDPAVVGDRRHPVDELHINDLLERVLDLGGSDLHLTVGHPPVVRVNGELQADSPSSRCSTARRSGG